MRILYLAFADLGVPKAWTIHVLATCRHLRALGHEVYLVTPEPSVGPMEEEDWWVRLPVGWVPVQSLREFTRQVMRAIEVWVDRRKVDVVYARLIPFAWRLAEAAHRARVPLVLEMNGIVTDELRQEGGSFLRRWLYGLSERRLLKQSDGVVGVTPAIAEWVRQTCRKARNVVAIENGTDPERFGQVSQSDARVQLSLAEGCWVGFVGSFFRSRALDTLVRAMTLVRKEVPDARLLLVGDGPDRAQVEEAARNLGEGAVTLLGEVQPERIPIALAAMDVCVFLSTLPRAQSPLKVFEYMAARRPIVASSTAGIGAWIEGMGAGISVDPASTESVARGIVDLLRDTGRARMMGEKGRAAVEEKYNWRRTATELASFLDRVVSEWKTHDAR